MIPPPAAGVVAAVAVGVARTVVVAVEESESQNG